MSTCDRPVLLVVDDEPGIVKMIERFASGMGFRVISHDGNEAVLSQLPRLKADVAMIDLRMPGVTGLDVLRAIREAQPTCQVILMTAHASVETAIEAVKLGALDYLTKPFDFNRVGALLTTVREGVARRERLFAADSKVASQFEFCGMIGRSPAMQELFDTIRRLAPHVRTALISGETGTGKELVARALHKMGDRRERRFVACNCSAVVESLFESEFFGHMRGAFTGATETKVGLFETADHGTLFLDEIGELPLVMQAKLLRVVEYGEVQRIGATETRRVDVRIIAATNRDLREEVSRGGFRQDLYYRLNIVEITLPPLRERAEDVAYLSAAFVGEFAKRFQKPLAGISPGAERLLQRAPWPGNIRELRNSLERACMLSEGRILSERDVLMALGASWGGSPRPGEAATTSIPSAGVPIPPDAPRAALDRDVLQETLQRFGGNKSATARDLGISRRALYRRLEAFGL
jgi:two-component system response regulator HydG